MNPNDPNAIVSPQAQAGSPQNPPAPLGTPNPPTQPTMPVGSPGLQMTSANPQTNQTNKNWQDSKLVKIGGTFLYFVWAAFIIGVYKGIGLLCLVIMTVALFITYRKYKKTKSPQAKLILQVLGGIVALFMLFSIYG